MHRKLASLHLDRHKEFSFGPKTSGIRVTVEWISSSNEICDLDIWLLLYDEKAKFLEKLNADSPHSSDKSCSLQADVDSHTQGASKQENVHISFPALNRDVSAMMVFIDGGPRNFQFVQRIVLHCWQENTDTDDTNFMHKIDSARTERTPLFYTQCLAHRDYEGLAALVLYKVDGGNRWGAKPIFDPTFSPGVRGKNEHCQYNIVEMVPSLHKYRPRLFPSVKHICSALSSISLPNLKDRFSKGKGLSIKPFTEVLFSHLAKSCDKVLRPEEAAYTVAMLHDLFGQIDYNGDGLVDWDEFTTFCIHTGLSDSSSDSSSLNEYTIEYRENFDIQDTVLATHAAIVHLRFSNELKRLMAIKEKDNGVVLLDEKFKQVSYLDPSKLGPQIVLKTSRNNPKDLPLYILDILYIASRDLFVYTASDHTIVFCKEHAAVGRKGTYYSLHNRICHAYLQVKLCWSELSKILCSVDSDNVIYGWDIDCKTPVFQLTRHKAKITDFIALDKHNLFATCSLDKRIVLWSQSTKRVKGVLLGHKRGIKILSHAKDTLLSAGFECHAICWDLNLHDPTFHLKGHRLPLVDAKLMLPKDGIEDNLKAVTVDDGGEFRLWSIPIREKGSISALAECLQTFTQSSLAPCKIGFLAVPFDPDFSKGNYSNIVASSNKLLHFRPEMTTKEFSAATFVGFSDPHSSILTSVGKSVHKYDVTSGAYLSTIDDVSSSEVTCFLLDGPHHRRLFVGTQGGDLILINYASGQRISDLQAHNKEITTIISAFDDDSKSTILFTGSIDGNIRQIRESSGKMDLQCTIENALGRRQGVHKLELVFGNRYLIGVGTMAWAIFSLSTKKKIFFRSEREEIAGFQRIGGGGVIDISKIKDYDTAVQEISEKIVTIAICIASEVILYAIDLTKANAVKTHVLGHAVSVHLSNIIKVSIPKEEAINYPSQQSAVISLCLVASSDDGSMIVWDAALIRKESLEKFYSFVPEFLEQVEIQAPRKRCASKFSRAASAFAKTRGISRLLSQRRDEKSLDFTTIGNNANEESAARDKQGNTAIESRSTSYICETNDDGLSQVSLLSFETLSVIDDASDGEDDKTNHENDVDSNDSDVHIKDSLVLGEEDSSYSTSCSAFKAHADAITCMAPLAWHGCIISCAHDGYHRIWNIHGDCLGEIALPNITEAMINGPKRYLGKWKFIVEKIPVTNYHEEISRQLVKSHYENKDADHSTVERRQGVSAGVTNKNPNKLSPNSPADSQRLQILSKLDYKVCNSSLHKKKDARSILRQVSRTCDNSNTEGGSNSAKESESCTNDSSLLRTEEWRSLAEASHSSVSAFSNASLATAQAEGIFDEDAYRMLSEVKIDKKKIEAYERSEPAILLRNVASSAVVEFPKRDVDFTEVNFGAQKSMYKNANKMIKDKMKYMNSSSAKHTLAAKRIKANISRMGNTVISQNKYHFEEVILPPLQDDSKEAEEKNTGDHPLLSLSRSRSSGRRNASFGLENMKSSDENVAEGPFSSTSARVLNREKILANMKKVIVAEESSVPEWEKRSRLPRRKSSSGHKKRDQNSQLSIVLLERKLIHAIKSLHEEVDKEITKKLTTRMLLPHYKMADLKNFLSIFQNVDEDLSGDLDVEEWVKFFAAVNKTVTPYEARMMFNKIDQKGDGFLTVNDLIPVVFSNANKEQQEMIQRFLQSELSKRKIVGNNFTSNDELETLFEHYDTNFVGYLRIPDIREKIKSFNLPDSVYVDFMSVLNEHEEDEMLNFHEFRRLFEDYISMS